MPAPPARARANAFSAMPAPSPIARRLTPTSPEGRGKSNSLTCLRTADLDDRIPMRITIFGNHRRLVPLTAFGIILCIAAFTPARAGMSDAVKAQTLPNGLRVLVLENHKAPLTTFNVFYRVGSRDEQFGRTGLSHLCEHLMFKGTKKIGPEEFC